MTEQHYLELHGFCPICDKNSTFIARGKWYRGTLMCQTCINGSTPRERALAFVLNREMPDWRDANIHECSPMQRGVSLKLRGEAVKYTGTHYFPQHSPGSIVDGWRNENIERTTFDNNFFDLVITLDVTEHVFNPEDMFKDIYRTLKPGGMYISTFPIRKIQVEPTKQLARIKDDNEIEFLKTPPEYHGNPIDGKGALVTWDYGYDIHQLISDWAPFRVEICRFSDRLLGILGEYTDVIVCRKPLNG